MKSHHAARGFSIVEGLVAAAVLTTTAVGTAALATYFVQASRRAQRMNAAVMLQSSLQNALLTRQQYAVDGVTGARLQQATAIRTGQPRGSYDGFQILSNGGGSIFDPGATKLAAINQRVYHKSTDLKGATGPCTGPSRDCDVYVDLDLDCAPTTGTGCAAAYRVGLDSDANDPAPAPLGALFKKDSNKYKLVNAARGFADVDYDFQLSHDLFTLVDRSDSGSSCNDKASDVLITGANRETGEVTCLKLPITPCMPDPNTKKPNIGHTVKAVGGHLEMSCHPMDSAKCPDHYVFQKFDLSQLDRGSAEQQAKSPVPLPKGTNLQGTCVYQWRTHIAWQDNLPPRSDSSSFTVSAKVCNADIYFAQSRAHCSVTRSDTPGCCHGPTGGCLSRPLSDVQVDESLNTPNAVAACTVTIHDNCGSSVVAQASWVGTAPVSTCEVLESKINPSLTKKPEFAP